MIRVQDLGKHFGAVKAVDGISFRVDDGMITGLLGPNGSGKTTTLRMLYTLLQVDSGSIEVDGIRVSDNKLAVKQRLGVMPDARSLYTRLTARENIRYYGELQGVSGDLLQQRIDELADQLEMHGYLDRRCHGFSSGQKAKVAIARAFVSDPHNLLLDEPGNGLDVMSNRGLRRFLLTQKDQGKAILLSTHIMQEVAALCDRIVIIANGRIKATGSAEQLLAQAGESNLEDAFVTLIGTDEGIMA